MGPRGQTETWPSCVWSGGVALDVRPRPFAVWSGGALTLPPLLNQKAACVHKSQMGSAGGRSMFLRKMSLQAPALVQAEPRAATRSWEHRGRVSAVRLRHLWLPSLCLLSLPCGDLGRAVLCARKDVISVAEAQGWCGGTPEGVPSITRASSYCFLFPFSAVFEDKGLLPQFLTYWKTVLVFHSALLLGPPTCPGHF